MRLKEILKEGPLRRDDPDMVDYTSDQDDEAQELAAAPYYVAWYAQSMEWYGDDNGPASGQGRYKPKGDGGRVVAINVATFDQAQKIADKLDDDYKTGDFEDKNVYGKYGEDWYTLSYEGAHINSMSKMDEYTKDDLKHVHPNFKPVDYANQK